MAIIKTRKHSRQNKNVIKHSVKKHSMKGGAKSKQPHTHTKLKKPSPPSNPSKGYFGRKKHVAPEVMQKFNTSYKKYLSNLALYKSSKTPKKGLYLLPTVANLQPKPQTESYTQRPITTFLSEPLKEEIVSGYGKTHHPGEVYYRPSEDSQTVYSMLTFEPKYTQVRKGSPTPSKDSGRGSSPSPSPSPPPVPRNLKPGSINHTNPPPIPIKIRPASQLTNKKMKNLLKRERKELNDSIKRNSSGNPLLIGADYRVPTPPQTYYSDGTSGRESLYALPPGMLPNNSSL